MKLSTRTVESYSFPLWKSVFQMVGLLCCPFPLIGCLSRAPEFLKDSPFNITRALGEGYIYQSYQRTMECTSSFAPLHPTTIEELQTIVLQALKYTYKVKAVGGLHSTTDTICTEGIPVDMKQIKHFSFDPRTNYATAGAGLEIQDFLELIHEQGRGLTGSPAYGGITVGGAVGTGAYGTNLKQAATLSDQLVSIKFVDGLGKIRILFEGDDDFDALRVHLGLLGIVYELVFRTTEQYKLEIRNFPVSDDILWKEGEIIRMAEANDWFQFYWYPTNRQVVLSVGNRVPVNTSGNCMSHTVKDTPAETSKRISETLEYMQEYEDQVGYFLVQSLAKLDYYQKVPGRTPVFTEEDGSTSCLPLAIGYSHRMITNRCKSCPWTILRNDEGASFIDVNELPNAMRTLKEITDSILVGFPLIGIIFRFLKESDAYLGLSNGRNGVNVEWISVARRNLTQPKLGIAALQAIGQALVEKHNARPHWAKNGLYYTSPKVLQRVHPKLENFVEAMNRLDPNEVFMNDFGRRLKHGSSDMTLSAEAKERCALNEACLCRKDSDCGDEGVTALVCGNFQQFKVCKKRSAVYNDHITDLNDKPARDTINSIVELTDDSSYVMEELSRYDGFGDGGK